MRTLEEHKVNPANDTLVVSVTDEPGAGGANHQYLVTGIANTTGIVVIILAIPVALYEMVLAGWLIANGFNLKYFNINRL